jgi:hypothetical protein
VCAWGGQQNVVETLSISPDGTTLQDDETSLGGVASYQYYLSSSDSTTTTFSFLDQNGLENLITLPLAALTCGDGVLLTETSGDAIGAPGTTQSTPCVRR